MLELVTGLMIAVWLAALYVHADRIERRVRRVPSCWRRAAADLGLELTAGQDMNGWSMDGRVGGCALRVHVVTHDLGKSSTTTTCYRVVYPSVGLGLELRPSGSAWRRFFERSDDGGPEDLARWTGISDEDARYLAEHLPRAARTAILDVLRRFPRATVRDASATAETPGCEWDPDRLAAHARAMARLASQLARA